MTPAEIKIMQGRLGFTPGNGQDGIAGRGTYTKLFQKLGAPLSSAGMLGLAAAAHFERFGISDSVTRLSKFLGQCDVESDGFVAYREYWGPTPAQSGYEGRADLGNTQPGDGKRYMGRSIGMITGRGNYRAVSAKLGIDVELQPELLERPDIGLLAFCFWWEANGANKVADTMSVNALSRLVNRGNANATKAANHENDRFIATSRALKLVA